MTIILIKKIKMTKNFKILIITFHILYVFNMHIKFHLNRVLFTIRFTKLIFKHLIDNITINL